MSLILDYNRTKNQVIYRLSKFGNNLIIIDRLKIFIRRAKNQPQKTQND